MNAMTKPEATAIAPRTGGFDLSPQTFEQALTFSQYLADSEMVPKAYRGKPGDCLIAMQWGHEVGLKALQSLQSIATINGKPGIFGDAGKAILLAAGCIIEEDDTDLVKQNGRARCKITRPGRNPVQRTFSVEDAKTAGLWNKEGPWKTYPYRQMAWRAFWFAARDCAADLLRGMVGAEELVDIVDRSESQVIEAVATPAPPPPGDARPAYSQADFDANLQSWLDAINTGKTTADAVIAKVETKGTLTDAQKDRIRGKLPTAPTGAPDADGVIEGQARTVPTGSAA